MAPNLPLITHGNAEQKGDKAKLQIPQLEMAGQGDVISFPLFPAPSNSPGSVYGYLQKPKLM